MEEDAVIVRRMEERRERKKRTWNAGRINL